MSAKKRATHNRQTGLQRGKGWVEAKPNGRFLARVHRGAGGSLGTYATHDDAVAALDAAIEIQESGTLGEYIDRYLHARRNDLSPTTYYQYRWLASTRITPLLGERQLHELDQAAIVEWWNKALSPTKAIRNGTQCKGTLTRSKAWRLLRQILAKARKDGKLYHDIFDPVKNAGRENSPERYLLDEKQVAALIHHLEPRLRIQAIIAAVAGLRKGEFLPLRLKDIDLERGRISVTRSAGETKDEGYFIKEPKSTASRRVVNIHPQIVELIKAHIAEYVPDPSPDSLLVQTRNGTPIRSSNWQQSWRKSRKAAGLDHIEPPVTAHDLRHHCITAVVNLSKSPREVMAFAGHSSMTSSARYQHLADSDMPHMARPFIAGTAEPADPPAPGERPAKRIIRVQRRQTGN